MSRLTDVNSHLVRRTKRGREAEQEARRFADEARARALYERWRDDEGTKTVSLWGPANARSKPRPLTAMRDSKGVETGG